MIYDPKFTLRSLRRWRKALRKNRKKIILHLTRNAFRKLNSTGGDRSSDLWISSLVLYPCVPFTLTSINKKLSFFSSCIIFRINKRKANIFPIQRKLVTNTYMLLVFLSPWGGGDPHSLGGGGGGTQIIHCTETLVLHTPYSLWSLTNQSPNF